MRYRAELTLDPGNPQLTGQVQIDLAVRKPFETFWLNASHLTVEDASLTVGGKSHAAKIVPGGEDFLGFQFETTIPTGTAEIRIKYRGTLRDNDSSGVFRVEDMGNRYIFTQFESTEARSAFPCFDEPAYKVPWQLTLHVPPQVEAVSNTPALRTTVAGSTRTYVFKETKPLPSYLIAFGVGPFEFVDAGSAGKNHVPVRIVTPKGRREEAKYAAEVTATILTRLENYFGVPYPYEKSDQVSLPVSSFGAMENAGMVTYGQSILLGKPQTDSLDRQRGYAVTAAHELAHQWFGDLVTLEWWNDIWLNEAFATWMERKLVAEWKPEWKTRTSDVQSKLNAEQSDSLITARKIRQEILSKGDIDNGVDEITYEKGASVIGMFESWMGAEEFRTGVRRYLQRYSFLNATAGDFLDALGSASKKEVGKPFSTFLDQAGVPAVSLDLDCRAKTPVLHASQSRYLPIGSKGSADRVWSIPLCVRYGEGSNQSTCALMTGTTMDLPLPQAGSCPRWVQGNDGAQGYYRVDYRGDLLPALTASGSFSAPERVELIGNTRAMARAGKLTMASALTTAQKFHDDPERTVVTASLDMMVSVQQYLVPESLLPNYERFFRQNYQARARELGWSARPGENEDVRLLRPALLLDVAIYGGDGELAREARQLAEQWLENRQAVSPEMVSSVLSTAAYYGDADLYRRFLDEFEKTQDRREREELTRALISFRDPKAIQIGLQDVLSRKIRLDDGIGLLFRSGARSQATRKLPFEFLKAHLDEIMDGNPSVQGFSLWPLLPNVGLGLCDEQSKQALLSFFSPLTKKYDGLQHNLDETVEGVEACAALVRTQGPSVQEFLSKY
jgi:alanyl aminopeptidase